MFYIFENIPMEKQVEWYSLEKRNMVFLCEKYWSRYFVMKAYKRVDGESIEILRLHKTYYRDDDELRDYFYENYEYKDNRKDAVRFSDYEGSLEQYTNEIDDNRWDYVGWIISPCNYSDVQDWYQEFIDSNVGANNIEDDGSWEIRFQDWKFNIEILNEIDTIVEENKDENVWTDVKLYFWLCDEYKFLSI